jgi:hypothetical protein
MHEEDSLFDQRELKVHRFVYDRFRHTEGIVRPASLGYGHEDRERDLWVTVAYIVVVVFRFDEVTDPDEFGYCGMESR